MSKEFEPRAHFMNLKWRSNDVKLQEKADFTSLLLSKNVLAGLEKSGFKTPSPIQLEAIPIGRFGRDLIVQAKSGTGKTLVFTIVALEMLLEVKHPQVLILAPTREIAYQICSVIKTVGSKFEDLKCCSFIGGTNISEDKDRAHDCQIAVGSPGRIKQLIMSGILKTNSIRLFVLDEADELLTQSFLSDIDDIFLTLPKDKQIIATSATYSNKLGKLSKRYFRNPFLARLNADKLSLAGIIHYTYSVPSSDMPVLVHRNKQEILESILTTVTFAQCLVFCNSIFKVKQLSADIKKWGFSTASISSAKQQNARLEAINNLKHFKCKILVSSDLTARGIDAENVDLIINYDAPISTEVYLHRSGRAGRYGSKGVAITFLTEIEANVFKRVEQDGNFKSYSLPKPIPVNLVNMRPEGFEIDQAGQISIDDSVELITEDDTCEASSDIEENNEKAFENDELSIPFNDKVVLESSIEEDIENTSFLDQNMDSNLCQTSSIESKPLESTCNNENEIPLADNFNLSDSSFERNQAGPEELIANGNRCEVNSCIEVNNERDFESDKLSIPFNDKAVLESSIQGDIEPAHSLDQNTDSNLCHISNTKIKPPEGTCDNEHEITLADNLYLSDFSTESATSCVDENVESQNKIKNPSSEISKTVKVGKVEGCSVVNKRKRKRRKNKSSRKSEPKEKQADVCKTIEDINENSIQNLGFEVNSESQFLSKTREDLAQTELGIQKKSITKDVCIGAEMVLKGLFADWEKAQSLEDDIDSPDGPVSPADIAQLEAGLSKYHLSVFNSFAAECIDNNSEVSVTEEAETEITEVPIEEESAAHQSLPQNQDENELGTVKETECSLEIENTLKGEVIFAECSLEIENTLKGEVIFAAKETEDSSNSSSSSSWEPAHSAKLLHEKFKEMVEKSYRKNPPRNGFMPTIPASICKNLTRHSAVKPGGPIFIKSSESSDEYSESSEIEGTGESTIKDEITFKAEATDNSECSSSDSCEASNHSFQETYKKHPLRSKHHRNISQSTAKKLQSPEATAHIVPKTKKKGSFDISCEIQKNQRGTSRYNRPIIASKANCKPQQFSRYCKNRCSHKSTNPLENVTQYNQAHNSSLHNTNNVSRHQKICDICHGNFPCASSIRRNNPFSQLQCNNHFPCNFSYLNHMCHFPHANSGNQTHLNSYWYDIFYRQWQHINYVSHFQ